MFEFKMTSFTVFYGINVSPNDKLYSDILIFHKNSGKAAALIGDSLLTKSCALHIRLPP